MQTNETILMPVIERLAERNLDIESRKDYSKIMENLGVEVL